MNASIRNAFLLLICLQAAHSIEEYTFGLYDLLPYFVWLNAAAGPTFALVNILVVALGFWCYLYRVRPNAPSARAWVWGWAVVEIANGIAHPTWTLLSGRYIPGTFTAPLLFLVGVFIVWRLNAEEPATA